MDALDLVTILGGIAMTAGVAMVSVPLALIVVGLFAILAARGYAIERKKAARG